MFLLLFSAIVGFAVYKLFFTDRTCKPNPPVVTPDDLAQYKKGDTVRVTDPSLEMPIKLSKKGVAAQAPRTVMAIFKDAVAKHGDKTALEVQRDGKYITWTWNEYYADTIKAAKAMIHLGLKEFSTVNILGFNSPEWVIANVGANAAGAKAAGIYATNKPEDCQYISEHCKAEIVFVENEAQLKKYLEIRDNLPELKAIVMWLGDVPAGVNKSGKVPVYTWEVFMQLGDKITDAEIEGRISNLKPGHCSTLIYTSGTTGKPKAVMISHDNITWTASLFNGILGQWHDYSSEFRMCSYLPLSHVAANMLDIHFPMGMAAAHSGPAKTVFARPDALKGTLKDTLVYCKPSLFFGVPRVWEKFHEAIVKKGKDSKGLKKAIATWAKSLGTQALRAREVGGSGILPALYPIADAIVFKKVRAALGMECCAVAVTGAAPINRDVLEFFGALGFPVMEVYGMSECTGPETLGLPNFFKTGSAGPTLPGCDIKIDHVPGRDPTKDEGEICFRGRHIMMGYMYNEQKTKEAIDDDGWLHSGDVGRVDENGLLYITGRIKELIITAGGENIAPVPVEEHLKSNLPGIKNAMMIGDKRKYCTVLITLHLTPNEDTSFSNNLQGPSLQIGSSAKTVKEAQECPKWKEYIENGIKVYNTTQSVSRAQNIQKFRILDTDFSVPGNELTPTLKLKRPIVVKKYADVIESMY